MLHMLAEVDLPALNDPILAMVVVIFALAGLVRVMAKIVERRDTKLLDRIDQLVDSNRELVQNAKDMIERLVQASDERRENRKELFALGQRIGRFSQSLPSILHQELTETRKLMHTTTDLIEPSTPISGDADGFSFVDVSSADLAEFFPEVPKHISELPLNGCVS